MGLTNLPPSYANWLEIWDPQPPGALRACQGADADCLVKKFVEVRNHPVSGEVSQNFSVPVGYELMCRYAGRAWKLVVWPPLATES